MGILAFTALSVGISAVSAVMQYNAASDSAHAAESQANAQKESIAAQGRMAEVEAQRARLAQVREARIKRAQIISTSTSTGLGEGTSGVSGATSSISTQESSNIGIIGQTQSYAQEASAANQRAADFASQGASATAKAQQWQTINTIFGANRQDMTTIFNPAGIKK